MNSFTIVIISSILRIHIRYCFNKLRSYWGLYPLLLSLSHPLCDDGLQLIREEALRGKNGVLACGSLVGNRDRQLTISEIWD